MNAKKFKTQQNAGSTPTTPQHSPGKDSTPTREKVILLQKKIQKLIEQDPKKAARLIELWLKNSVKIRR